MNYLCSRSGITINGLKFEYEIGNYLCCAVPHTNFFKSSSIMLEMGRPNYVCATCSEHFTRKYSATRHNHNLHNGAAEIVRLIDYLAGRFSGQYKPDNPFWYKRNNPYDNIGGTVADTVGDAFQARYNPRQEPLGTSQYHTSRLPPTMEDQKFRSALSRETT
ncbi:MAG: hypothetical protein WA364_03920 [Candidatus Nitrosopolaris sp.]